MSLLSLGARCCALTLVAAPAAAVAAEATPFSWLDGSTVSITTGNSSANVALQQMPTGATQVRVFSNCATPVFIRKGTSSSVIAAATDLPVAPGEVEVMTLTNTPAAPTSYLAMISPSGSCTIYFTIGSGI